LNLTQRNAADCIRFHRRLSNLVSARAQRCENPWIPAAFEPNKTVTVLVYKAATTDLRKAKVFFFKRMRDNV
jgi:hypothetical protein